MDHQVKADILTALKGMTVKKQVEILTGLTNELVQKIPLETNLDLYYSYQLSEQEKLKLIQTPGFSVKKCVHFYSLKDKEHNYLWLEKLEFFSQKVLKLTCPDLSLAAMCSPLQRIPLNDESVRRLMTHSKITVISSLIKNQTIKTELLLAAAERTDVNILYAWLERKDCPEIALNNALSSHYNVILKAIGNPQIKKDALTSLLNNSNLKVQKAAKAKLALLS